MSSSAVKAYADTHPNLSGEDAKLLRKPCATTAAPAWPCPRPQRDEVEGLRKKLTALETDFEANIDKAEQKLIFTRAEMEGVPEDFLEPSGCQ